MIASLSMYARPETEAALGRLWNGVRTAFPGQSPLRLEQDGDLWAHWSAHDLFLSQTCGMPYRTRLHDLVALVATPVTGLDCAPGFYDSAIIARRNDSRGSLRAFGGACLAYNDALSQSGWAAPMTLASREGVTFAGFLRTGAHRTSAEAVAAGRADLAAIDGVTWQMIVRWDSFAAELKVIARTPPTPALPFITARWRDPGPLRDALSTAIAGLADEDRDILSLHGVIRISPDAYLAVPTPPPPPR